MSSSQISAPETPGLLLSLIVGLPTAAVVVLAILINWGR